ncbi:MAG: reverse transcriptase-like protein [Myxococcota bacterium]
MASRRRKEPTALALIKFIADHESLQITSEEFYDTQEERIRQILRDYVKANTPVSQKRKRGTKERAKPASRVVLICSAAVDDASQSAAAGWIVSDEKNTLISEGKAFLGRRSDGEALYESIIRGLVQSSELGFTNLGLRCVDDNTIKQINGSAQVKQERMQVLHTAAREVIQRFKRFEAKRLPSDDPAAAAAHALARAALDEGET